MGSEDGWNGRVQCLCLGENAFCQVRFDVARNLFNETYYTSLTASRPGAEFGVLGDPQTFSVRLDASF